MEDAAVGALQNPDPSSASHCDLELAHVLFLDIVGYSLLSMEQQRERIAKLQDRVHALPRVRAGEEAKELIALPTGDGMAIVFFRDPTAPVQAAVELAAALWNDPEIRLRTGINSGPVYRVHDVNHHANVAGGGINMAQRVMDCGDAGHILLSQSTAEVLGQMDHWATHVVPLGECEVKHGVKVRVYNLVSPQWGNAAKPAKLRKARSGMQRRRFGWAAAAAGAAAAVGAYGWLRFAGVETPAIAVLPFLDLSAEKDQAYLSDGLAEELLDGLARIPGLRVAARFSSFQFRDKRDNFREIAEKLNVSAILDGSVRRQGNRARIAVELVKAADGFRMWAETFDRDLRDVLTVQRDIARAVTDALKVRLLVDAAPPRQLDPEAYNAYLLGRYFYGRSSKNDLALAEQHYSRALELQPDYAVAWQGLGQTRMVQADGGYIDVAPGYRSAIEALEKGLSLDSKLAESQAALGWLQIASRWDWNGAEAPIRRALEIEPNNPQVIRYAARLARCRGRYDEAEGLLRRGALIDPLAARTFHTLGFVLYYAGKLDEAQKPIERALELTPEMANARLTLARVLLGRGRKQEALAAALAERHPAYRLMALSLVHHALGHNAESRNFLNELETQYAKEDAFQVAEVYAFRGEHDRAFEWLDRAYAERDPGFSELKGDPLMRSIEKDPRMAAFLAKIGSP